VGFQDRHHLLADDRLLGTFELRYAGALAGGFTFVPVAIAPTSATSMAARTGVKERAFVFIA